MSKLCQQRISRALNQEDTFAENLTDLDVWPMWITCVHCCDAHRRFSRWWMGNMNTPPNMFGVGQSIYLWSSKHPVDVWILKKDANPFTNVHIVQSLNHPALFMPWVVLKIFKWLSEYHVWIMLKLKCIICPEHSAAPAFHLCAIQSKQL